MIWPARLLFPLRTAPHIGPEGADSPSGTGSRSAQLRTTPHESAGKRTQSGRTAGGGTGRTGGPPPSEATSLYRCFNADGTLLYVGITACGLRRFAAHQKDSPWWSKVARVDVKHFASRTEAAEAETRAIAEERPRYNIRGRRQVEDRASAGPSDRGEHLLPVNQAASELGLAPERLAELLDRGLPRWRFLGEVRVRPREARDWIEARS